MSDSNVVQEFVLSFSIGILMVVVFISALKNIFSNETPSEEEELEKSLAFDYKVDYDEFKKSDSVATSKKTGETISINKGELL